MSEAQAKYGIQNTDAVTKELEKWKVQGANMLLPSTSIEGLSDFHAPVIDSVYLSANPKDGDIYPAKNTDDNKFFRLTAQALRKLSVCAGIIWHPYECRRLDDRKDRNYVAFQAVGGIRKADGQPVWWKGEYDQDFAVIEEELIDQYDTTVSKWATSKIEWQKKASDDYKKNYIERSVRRDLLFKRKHKLKLAETGAMNRVVRAILGLKGAYTLEELSKPFVMLRIVLRPDYTDKDVRAKLADAAIRAMVGIYGPETPIEQRQADLSGLGDVIDLKKEEEEPDPENGYDDAPSAREVFVALEIDEKVKFVRELARKKKYNIEGLEHPPEKLSERLLIQLYDHLDALLYDHDDDIPF